MSLTSSPAAPPLGGARPGAAAPRVPPPALREFGYWLHRYRRTWRGTVVVSVANPLLFLAAMGAGLGKLVNQGGSDYLHGTPYLHFFAPGLLAAAAMQNAFVDSAGPVFQSTRARGNYRAAAATPMRPSDIFAGHLLFMAMRVASGALAFLLVATVAGAVPWERSLLLLPVATLVGCAFAAPLAAWAVTVTQFTRINGVFRFVLLPLYMFSGTFYSPDQLPGWLHAVVMATPLYHGIQLCRSIALSTASAGPTTVHLLYLVAMATAGVLIGRRTYTRHLHG
ncbi:ABC transporter permease [Streptomyces sp. NBC_00223]|uniref:ABC transporter permease n=1 Tax=Streptomyces sp. NBC_00223 TaxID=2976008 RepID=UPI002E2B23CE|nr:ABC transporter permease [Streptomyces sp. NBC_00223]